jgi:hypothetical protein
MGGRQGPRKYLLATLQNCKVAERFRQGAGLYYVLQHLPQEIGGEKNPKRCRGARPMKKFVMMIVALGLAAAFAGPTFAADAPKTKADCEKAKMKWDDTTKKCSKGSM